MRQACQGLIHLSRRRLDIELVRRGLASSRASARDLIVAGRVTVGGAPAFKPARLVDPAEALLVTADPPRYVSRGGQKLEAALAEFAVEVAGSRVIDVGASTGGFSDCLLQHGAACVVALDVGRNQLHERLRADSRVSCRERTDVRCLDPDEIGGAAQLVVADLSFISLRAVADDLARLASAQLIVLVKPQFEVGRAAASRGRGVIREPALWCRAIIDVCRALQAAGAAIMGLMVSPVTGRDGNVEFFAHADFSSGAAGIADLDREAGAVTALAEVSVAPADAVAAHVIAADSGPGEARRSN